MVDKHTFETGKFKYIKTKSADVRGWRKMSSRPVNKRPSLTRAETIESCNSDDLVTVLEVPCERKPYKIIDRSREVKKGVVADSLEELIERGKEKLNYPLDKAVYVVLEEDGTEVDEEEYFHTLPENTLFMLLYVGEKWSPFGLPIIMYGLLENEIQV